MKILITGAAGYVGARLTSWLAEFDHHEVTAFDTEWFGKGYFSEDNKRVRFIKGDVRDARAISDAMQGQECVIWLASISNNDMCVKYPQLHDRINMDAVPLALLHARNKHWAVKRFIYASSVAAYGSSNEMATEETLLTPTTPYGLAKKYAEQAVMLNNSDELTTVVTRSASVCGYSVHQRFDLTVNKMVHDACRYGVIKVNGGYQKRCHIHIKDIVDAYRLLVTAPKEKIAGQAFNFVAENQSVLETANIVAEECSQLSVRWNPGPPFVSDFVNIQVGPATDDRSYTVDGTKAREVLGFVPKFTVRDAVRDLASKVKAGVWKDLDNPHYMNMAEGLR